MRKGKKKAKQDEENEEIRRTKQITDSPQKRERRRDQLRLPLQHAEMDFAVRFRLARALPERKAPSAGEAAVFIGIPETLIPPTPCLVPNYVKHLINVNMTIVSFFFPKNTTFV